MNFSVNLYTQPNRWTIEIQYEWTVAMLLPKFAALNLPPFEVSP